MPSNFFRINVSGEWTMTGRPTIACPRCKTTQGIAVEGRPGDPGMLRHCGTFPFPHYWDARRALLDAIHKAGRISYAR
jgi:hypothetical protein